MPNQSTVNRALQNTPIAIIGLAGVFPQARNLQEYWDNIIYEVDCITDVPASRWRIEDYYDPDPKAPDKTYCKRGGFLPDIDFNPMEFGLPPNILEVTDVSQLLSLVVAKQAIEDAGYASKPYKREKTGVILGVGGGQKLITPLTTRLQYPIWDRVLESSGVPAADRTQIIEKMKKAYIGWEENSFPGMLGNVIAGRIANRLDLGGTNCVVDAACAASLAAVKMAISELTEYRAETMITGGVDTDNSIFMYMSFSKTPAFSKQQEIRPFDANSDGMMIGEAVSMVVLKRLEDAERDGDRIYAVIKGVGSSSDGRYKSIYAPRASGQARAVDRAYEDAGVSPASIGLVEAHGTGTAAGDPTEFSGLNEVFSHNNPRRQYIGLGSIKSQIGHTKAAAGAASLVKVALALHHKVLPPTLNVDKPNPKMDIENTPFYVNAKTRPWIKPADGTPRRAGVSAFGFGGTNFHFVLEEHTAEPADNYRLHRVPQMILLSGSTPAQLLTKGQETITQLQSTDAESAFLNLTQTSEQPVAKLNARLGFVAADAAEAAELLQTGLTVLQKDTNKEEWQHPKGIFYRRSGMDTAGKVVALFPGQGSQYVEMGKELAVNFPEVRQAFHDIDQLFMAENKPALSETVFPIPAFDEATRNAQNTKLQLTENVQPAIGALSYSMYKLLEKAGFKPNFAAGHSFGELTALWAGGVLSDNAFFYLMKERGQAMAAPSDPNFDAGTMLAVKGAVTEIYNEVQSLPGVEIANYNSTQQVVLAGSQAAVQNAERHLKAKGYVAKQLPVSAAFHTALVGHAQQPFAQAIQRTPFSAPRIPVYTNTTSQPYSSHPEAIKQSLQGHILNPVLFQQQIENIYNAGGTIFVEIGPKRVLTNLVSNILGDRPHVAVAVNGNWRKDSDQQLREAVVQMRVLGMSLSQFDTIQRPRTLTPTKRSPINVYLGGHNYVSPKTQKAYQDALSDDHQINIATHPATNGHAPQPKTNGTPQKPAPQPSTIHHPPPTKLAPIKNQPATATATTPTPVAVTSPPPAPQPTTIHHSLPTQSKIQNPKSKIQNPNGITMNNSTNLHKQIEESLEKLHQHQADTARAHETYLRGQEQYVQTVSQLLQQLAGQPASAPVKSKQPAAPAPVAPVPAPAPVAAVPAPAPVAPPAPAAPPAPVSIKPSNGHHPAPPAPVAPPAPQPAATSQPPAASTPPAASPPSANGQAVAALAQSMLEVVSDKTGYPAEMLELSMDMESDLGIDSIKRVEILGAMQEKHPDLPAVNPNELAELRTLQEIVDHMGDGASVSQPASAPAATSQPPAASPPAASGEAVAVLAQSMLEVVSDKTGYPAEMLELSMDMESDLGIDSIKRVEILGAMQEKHPDLPAVNPNELAELRTLQEIVDHMGDSSSLGQPVSAPATNGHQPAATSQPPAAISQSQVAALAQSMLEVVSEKTGYPAEMLELSMDMESDLGIDSIKRVEILGAMQDKHPDLPAVNPNELAELRTLQEIVDNLGKADPATAGAGFPATTVNTVDRDSVPAPTNHAITRNVAVLRPLPTPDYLAFNPTTCLITDDGTALTTQLAQLLADRGWQVQVLSLPQSIITTQPALPAGVTRLTLPDMSEAQLQAHLAQAGNIGAFIHLHPAETAHATAILKQTFFAAKHLKETLDTAVQTNSGRVSFLTVARLDGALGMGGTAPFDPLSGGLFGLTKTLNLEWPQIFCRALDLHPNLDADTAAAHILAELHDPNQLISEVGLDGQRRVTLDTVVTPLTAYTPNPTITADSVFVVSGGAKGITADCVIRLANQYQCKFVLLGRSSIKDVDTSWLGQYDNEAALKRLIMQRLQAQGEKPTPMLVNKMARKISSKREIEGTLNTIREAGGAAEYVSVDVTDQAAVQQALSAAQQRLGQITGLIHGAGVLSDKLIEKKTEAGFAAVYGTKINGLNALLSAVPAAQLQHVVLYSSAAGFYGNVGQADYALANDILNKTAQRIKLDHPHCHVVAIDWGPWDGGMVTPALKKLFAERNIHVIPIDVGTWILANELTQANKAVTQIVVGGELAPPTGVGSAELHKHRLQRTLTAEANPFLQDHVIGGHPVLPTVCAIAWMGNTGEQLYPGYTFFSCEEYQVLKGIVFDEDTSSHNCIVDVEEIAKSDEEIRYKALIWSENEPGKKRFHYRATLILRAKLPEAPIYQNMDLTPSNPISGAEFYESGALFHGPSFVGVEEVLNITPQKITMRCNLPPISQEAQGQFQVQSFNPFIADGQFQSMVIWARHFKDAGSLPLYTTGGEQYRPIPFGETTYVSMEVRESSDTNLTADIITHDETGRIYARVIGAQVTISQQLNHLFVAQK